MISNDEIKKIISSIRERIKKGSEGLVFDPVPHTYTYQGVQLKPVSAVCEIFAPEFDTQAKAEGVAKKRGVPVEVILEEWKQASSKACEEGTEVHAYGEWNFYRSTGLPVNMDDPDVSKVAKAIQEGKFVKGPREEAIDDVWTWLEGNEQRSYKLIPVAAENTIVNPKLRYAGTFDLLFLLVKPDDSYGLIIFDYKTNANLFNIFKPKSGNIETMKYPFNGVMNCNIAHYMCQLNLYQLGLERIIKDIPILGRILFWVNPQGVTLIDKNDPSIYKAAGEKWPRLCNAAEEVARLKRQFQFAKVGKFGMVRLPHVADYIDKYLECLIKATGKI